MVYNVRGKSLKRLMNETEIIQSNFLKAYDEYADALFRHCYFRVSSREVALDLTQDIFTKTWEYLSQGKEVKNIKAFLFQVARNIVIDYYRKHKSVSLDVELENGVQFEDMHSETGARSEISHMLSALEKLPEQYREILRLRYIDDLSVSEIAETIGEKENAVSVRIHRGVEKLKEILHIHHE
ncbi:MAG: hypothetical protein RJA61_345 [Candidatus Parcubacteria bacterium]|jgi:RNA polymerase sigma-70 factor (ECF subfamily)